MKPELTLQEIFKEIVGRSRNECLDEPSTWEYFEKYNLSATRSHCVNMGLVRSLAKSLNFAGIRENADKLYSML